MYPYVHTEPDLVVPLPIATSGGAKSRLLVRKLNEEPLDRLPALHRGRILADKNLKMLRSSIRSVSGRLFRGSYPSLARSTCPWGMASMISYEPSSFKLCPAALQHKQKRCYKTAAEETNKGVVSGLSCKSLLVKFVAKCLAYRTLTTHFYKGTLRIMWMKCTWNGRKTRKVYTYHGRSTFGI